MRNEEGKKKGNRRERMEKILKVKGTVRKEREEWKRETREK